MHERRNQSLCRLDECRYPRSAQHVAERPERSTDVISDMRAVEPSPFVAHEVAHPATVLVGRIDEECERAIEDRRPHPVPRAPFELERDNSEPRNVIDAVAGGAIGDRTVRMLHDAVQQGQGRLAAFGSLPLPHTAAAAASRSTAAVRFAIDGQPNVLPTRAASARARASDSGSLIRPTTASAKPCASPKPTSAAK